LRGRAAGSVHATDWRCNRRFGGSGVTGPPGDPRRPFVKTRAIRHLRFCRQGPQDGSGAGRAAGAPGVSTVKDPPPRPQNAERWPFLRPGRLFRSSRDRTATGERRGSVLVGILARAGEAGRAKVTSPVGYSTGLPLRSGGGPAGIAAGSETALSSTSTSVAAVLGLGSLRPHRGTPTPAPAPGLAPVSARLSEHVSRCGCQPSYYGVSLGRPSKPPLGGERESDSALGSVLNQQVLSWPPAPRLAVATLLPSVETCQAHTTSRGPVAGLAHSPATVVSRARSSLARPRRRRKVDASHCADRHVSFHAAPDPRQPRVSDRLLEGYSNPKRIKLSASRYSNVSFESYRTLRSRFMRTHSSANGSAPWYCTPDRMCPSS